MPLTITLSNAVGNLNIVLELCNITIYVYDTFAESLTTEGNIVDKNIDPKHYTN